MHFDVVCFEHSDACRHSQEAHQDNRPNENKYFQSRIIHNETTRQKPPSVGYLGLV